MKELRQMALKANLDRLDGDNKKRAHDFIGHIVNDLRRAVQASDIQAVRDIANELEQNRDMAVDAISGTGPSHQQKTQDAEQAARQRGAQASGNDPKAGGGENKNPSGMTQQPPGGAPGKPENHRDARS
jgi:hypothetical protein